MHARRDRKTCSWHTTHNVQLAHNAQRTAGTQRTTYSWHTTHNVQLAHNAQLDRNSYSRKAPNKHGDLGSHLRGRLAVDSDVGYPCRPFIIGTLICIIGTLIRITGTLIRIIGTLIRIIGTLIRIIGTLICIIGTLIRIIGTLIRM
jgi:hypothetical protein